MVNVGTFAVKELDDGWTVVTYDGKLSAHYENTVAILDDGPEILTLKNRGGIYGRYSPGTNCSL